MKDKHQFDRSSLSFTFYSKSNLTLMIVILAKGSIVFLFHQPPIEMIADINPSRAQKRIDYF